MVLISDSLIPRSLLRGRLFEWCKEKFNFVIEIVKWEQAWQI